MAGPRRSNSASAASRSASWGSSSRRTNWRTSACKSPSAAVAICPANKQPINMRQYRPLIPYSWAFPSFVLYVVAPALTSGTVWTLFPRHKRL